MLGFVDTVVVVVPLRGVYELAGEAVEMGDGEVGKMGLELLLFGLYYA
jgi:hypothetical protein